MSFNGTRETCPNYDSENGQLDMSYDTFMNLFTMSVGDDERGKSEFNKTCFNICGTLNEDGSGKGPTYIEDGECNECGSRGSEAGKYEMCNMDNSDLGDDQNTDRAPQLWFIKQQAENLLNLTTEPESDIQVDYLYENSNSVFSGLKYDESFESCVNDKLNTGSDDYNIQERISNYTSINELIPSDINYLKKKIKKIIAIETDQVSECMDLLNLGKSICNTGIADKTMMIGSLIFKIMGNDKIDIMSANEDEKVKINKLVTELGSLIPKVIETIIRVSIEYETRVCNKPSATTSLLEKIHTELYTKQTQVTLGINPYIDLDSLIGTKDHWEFGKKITVLVVFAFLLMQFANLVVAFLSRGSGDIKLPSAP